MSASLASTAYVNYFGKCKFANVKMYILAKVHTSAHDKVGCFMYKKHILYILNGLAYTHQTRKIQALGAIT